MRISLTKKLQLPSVLLLIMLVFVVGATWHISTNLQQVQTETAAMRTLRTQISTAATTFGDFAAGEVGFEAAQGAYQTLGGSIDLENLQAFLERNPGLLSPQDAWSDIEALAAMQENQRDLQGRLAALTGGSIEQSRSYITATAQRLADPEQAEAVTQLERLVVMGADRNTALNYDIQLRFNELAQGGGNREALLTLLDEALANARSDQERLAGTPFLGMVQQAVQTNEKIKEIVLEFVREREQMTTRATALASGMGSVLAAIDRDSEEAMQAAFARIDRLQKSFIGSFSVVALIILAVSSLVGRQLARSIRSMISVVSQIAEGDTDLSAFEGFLASRSRDEMDELRDRLRRMAAALHERARLAFAIADGDLRRTVQVHSERDELGLAIQRMSDSLVELVGRVRSASDRVGLSASQVSEASLNLSQGSTELASSVEEISSSMVEVHNQTKQNSEDSETARLNMAESREIVERTLNTMAEMAEAMTEIDASGQEISNINKVIDDLAFQTNLLALNAAVEAARAGQHGKGFAVVAEEVRTLAGRSAKAARETFGLVETTLQKVSLGNASITRLKEQFNEVVANADQVARVVDAIADQTRQQSTGIGEINSGLQQIDQVSQTNAASAEETSAVVDELSSMSRELQRMLTRFKLADGRGPADPEPEAETPRQAEVNPVMETVGSGGWAR